MMLELLESYGFPDLGFSTRLRQMLEDLSSEGKWRPCFSLGCARLIGVTMLASFQRIAKHSVRVLLCHARLALTKVIDDPVEFCLNNAIRPLQVPSELRRLGGVISALKPKHAMEIGTRNGGTLFILCRLADPEATVISMDLPGGNYGGGYSQLLVPLFKKFPQARQELKLLRQDSHLAESFTAVKGICTTLDYLFIDGDHTYAGVKQDFETYGRLTRSGGIVAFHDILPDRKDPTNEVHRFWNEIKFKYRYTEIIEDSQQDWGGIGVLHI